MRKLDVIFGTFAVFGTLAVILVVILVASLAPLFQRNVITGRLNVVDCAQGWGEHPVVVIDNTSHGADRSVCVLLSQYVGHVVTVQTDGSGSILALLRVDP